jgi:hypothetical protein
MQTRVDDARLEASLTGSALVRTGHLPYMPILVLAAHERVYNTTVVYLALHLP